MTLPENPESRVENYLGVMAGQASASLPAQPESRMEQYLDYIATNPSGGGTWGSITGKISNQTDLQNALDDIWDTDEGTTWEYGQQGTTPAYSQTVLNAVRPASINMIGGKTTVNAGELVNAVVTNVKSLKADTTVVAQFPISTTVRDMCSMYGSSAGTAYNYIDFKNKVYHKTVNSIDLGTLEWTMSSSAAYGNVFYAQAMDELIKDKTMYQNANILCSLYETTSISNLMDEEDYDKSIAYSLGFAVRVRDDGYEDATAFKSAMSGVTLYYELATESTVNLSSVLTDNKIEVVSGGSIIFENTNNTQVPNEVMYAVKSSVVKYTQQTLTDGQKAQARTNIGASDFSGSYNDLTNKPTAATTSTDGLMSSTDKAKLDGIATGAEVNVQSDWNVTDTTADAYIANKPTIRNVPESTTADAGKVLRVDASGDAAWQTLPSANGVSF